MARQKLPDVIVRRGNIDLGRVNLDKIPDQLQEGKLLGSDRISLNGQTWFRLDQFPELNQVARPEKSFLEKDLSELIKKKYPDVTVRRGRIDLGTINLKKIPDKIQEGKFLPSDRISINGETWHQLDKLPELKYFFLNKRIEEIQQRRERWLRVAQILGPLAVTLVLAIALYLMPYLTFYRAIEAIETRDDRTFAKLIDPAALAQPENTPLSPGSMLLHGKPATASGIRSLIELNHWNQLRERGKTKTVPVNALPDVQPFRKEDIFPYARLQYLSPDTFSVVVQPTHPGQAPMKMTLTRSFLAWKISHISIF